MIVSSFTNSNSVFLPFRKHVGDGGISEEQLKVDVIVNILLVDVESVSIIYSSVKSENITLLHVNLNKKLILFEGIEAFVCFFFQYINPEVCFQIKPDLCLVWPY